MTPNQHYMRVNILCCESGWTSSIESLLPDSCFRRIPTLPPVISFRFVVKIADISLLSPRQISHTHIQCCHYLRNDNHRFSSAGYPEEIISDRHTAKSLTVIARLLWMALRTEIVSPWISAYIVVVLPTQCILQQSWLCRGRDHSLLNTP